jgi:NADH-quinone oxidoreductase subunit H
MSVLTFARPNTAASKTSGSSQMASQSPAVLSVRDNGTGAFNGVAGAGAGEFKASSQPIKAAPAMMGGNGIVLAGWSSNSKYSLLGALRASAQMISYEISLGLSFAAVILLASSLSLTEIVNQQAGYWHLFGVVPIPKWYIFIQPLGVAIFLTAGVAETNRAPFDFPEAEQELAAGYHTEYSSMSFALFFLAEYVNMVTVSAVATNLFLGGWHGPFLPESLGWIWFLIKVFGLLFFYIWMRWTLPRYRYDQLMEFGWKWLLPGAVLNLLVSAYLAVTLLGW